MNGRCRTFAEHLASSVDEGDSSAIILRYFAASADLITVAGELAAKHIYLDPHDAATDAEAKAYCALCLRYGLNCRAIDHAESCLVGRTVRVLADLEVLFRSAAARFEAKLAAIASQQPVAPVEDDTRSRIEYFVQGRNFNPYSDPCAAVRGDFNCEMEAGHSGPHRAGTAAWADSGSAS